MAYEDFKDLNRRTFVDKVLRDQAFIIAKDPKYDQRCLASMVYKYFDENISASFIKNKNVYNKELAKELHKPIIRNFNKRKVYSPFIDNIWCTDLANMHLCVIDIYSKYAWVIPLNNKKRMTASNAFPKILKDSNRKPSKIWLDKENEFYNRSMKSWLEKRCYRYVLNT